MTTNVASGTPQTSHAKGLLESASIQRRGRNKATTPATAPAIIEFRIPPYQYIGGPASA